MKVLTYIISTIAYSIGYIAFVKLNKSKLDNCWKYSIIFTYSTFLTTLYFLISIQ